MAFDLYVRFYIGTDNDGNDLVVTYDNVQYTELYAWGEYVLSPVLSDVTAVTLTRAFNQGGTVVVRVPYDPRITSAFVAETREGQDNSFRNVSWRGFDVGGIRYVIDSMQIVESRRAIEVTGINGAPIVTI